MYQERVPVLDGLRGVAILLVMMHHMTVFTPRIPVDALFVQVANVGWCGVDLFFVLSGFLITGILLDSRDQPHYFRNFWARRILRIFPLYYACVFLALIILPELHHSKMANFSRIAGDEIWYWVFLSNLSIAFRGAFRHAILDVSWSLAIEEQFYLLWPLVVVVLSRVALPRLCVALLVFSLGFRLWLVSIDVNPIAVYTITLGRLDGLAIGALIATQFHSRDPAIVKVFGNMARKVAPFLLFALIAALVGSGGTDWASPPIQTVGYTLFALLFGCFTLIALSAKPGGGISNLLSTRALRFCGKYSYAMYLFHVPLRALIRDTVYGPDAFGTIFGSQIPGQMLFYGLAGGLTVIVAWLSWHLYEKHFLKMKEWFPYDNLAPERTV